MTSGAHCWASQQRRRARRRHAGMTLVEVMMAFAILVAGLVGVFAMVNAGIRSHRRAIRETEASLVASSVMDELRAEFFRGRTARSSTRGVFTDAPDYPGYKYCQTVIALESERKSTDPRAADREYFVRVEVRWGEQGENRSIVVDTIMYCNRVR